MKIIGDGIHDDTAGIQEALDERKSAVYLPAPSKHYLISKTLQIHSKQTLLLDRFTEIRLAPRSDCLMITNDNPTGSNEQIAIIGGIWNMDNQQQSPNPIAGMLGISRLSYDPHRYWGICMRFVNVRNFTLKSVTFRDPVTYCTQFARMEYFGIDDVTFDFQHYNPLPYNMDGIHLDGYCRFGSITNIKGVSNDDVVALNADDMEGESPCFGPIEDIVIDGIYARDCHSAVRLLSSGSHVHRISISNVFGTYYQYGIGFTKFFISRKGMGDFDDIILKNIHCSKAPRHTHYLKDGGPVFPLVWCERDVKIGRLSIENFHRTEENVPIQSIGIDSGATVDSLMVSDASFKNLTNQNAHFLVNNGTIQSLVFNNVKMTAGSPDDKLIVDNGAIEECAGCTKASVVS